jgi:hypothetical protein
MAPWDVGLADLSAVADKVNVKWIDTLGRYKFREQIMSAVSVHFGRSPETAGNTMHVRIDGHSG